MSGKKKIAYPMKINIKTEEPVFYNSANDKYLLHKELIDSVLNGLNGTYQVGYVKRDRPFRHGINANSLNEALRNKLAEIPGIGGETDVVFGSFLPPVHSKGEFDFSIVDKISNFYNFWNHCCGKSGVIDGDQQVDYYIRDEKTKLEWDSFIKRDNPQKHKSHLVVPEHAFNLIGEIQFGNWAMVYKDMFRLVSAINKSAKIDMYIYVVADGDLLSLMSDQVVGLSDAIKRFKENTENHNINKPVMIVPLNLSSSVNDIDFSEAEKGYDDICKQIVLLEKKLAKVKDAIKKKKEEYKTNKAQEIKKQIDTLTKRKKNTENKIYELKSLYRNKEEFDEE